MSVEGRLFDARVHIVTGKGGVGKSTVALSLALLAARRGRKTLFLETNPSESAARFLNMSPLTGDPRRVDANLTMAALIPADAIKEYALMILKFAAIYNAVFENRVVRYFLRAVPSLGEFVMLGKLWFHEQERNADGSPRYETIVVDAPATGHLISWLRVPHVFVEMMPAGPLKSSSRDFLDMLLDPRRCKIDVVTLPEEMPVNEAVEIEHAINMHRLGTRGLTFVNKTLRALSPGAVDKIDGEIAHAAPRLQDALRPLRDVVATHEHWRTLGERYLQRLSAEDLSSAIRIERSAKPMVGRAAFDALATHIEASL